MVRAEVRRRMLHDPRRIETVAALLTEGHQLAGRARALPDERLPGVRKRLLLLLLWGS